MQYVGQILAGIGVLLGGVAQLIKALRPDKEKEE